MKKDPAHAGIFFLAACPLEDLRHAHLRRTRVPERGRGRAIEVWVVDDAEAAHGVAPNEGRRSRTTRQCLRLHPALKELLWVHGRSRGLGGDAKDCVEDLHLAFLPQRLLLTCGVLVC